MPHIILLNLIIHMIIVIAYMTLTMTMIMHMVIVVLPILITYRQCRHPTHVRNNIHIIRVILMVVV